VPAARRSLATVLRYRNRRVVDRFLRHYALGRDEADELFRDVLRFLWLRSVVSHELVVLRSQFLFDEMWHAFILHTRDYERFCRKYFGRVMHHEPGTPKRRSSTSDQRAIDATIEAVFDRLGEAIAERWFVTQPARFPPERIERIRIPLTAR
jgi:hypothetical protein